MHGGALAQKASKQKELSDHKLVKASNKRHGGGYSACALDNLYDIYVSNLIISAASIDILFFVVCLTHESGELYLGDDLN